LLYGVLERTLGVLLPITGLGRSDEQKTQSFITMENKIGFEKKPWQKGQQFRQKHGNEIKKSNQILSADSAEAVADSIDFTITNGKYRITAGFPGIRVIAARRMIKDIENSGLLVTILDSTEMIQDYKLVIDGLRLTNRLPTNVNQILQADPQIIVKTLSIQNDARVQLTKAKKNLHEAHQLLQSTRESLRKFIKEHIDFGEIHKFQVDLDNNEFELVLENVQVFYLSVDISSAFVVGQYLDSFRKLSKHSIEQHLRIIEHLAWSKALLEGTNMVNEMDLVQILIRSLSGDTNSPFYKDAMHLDGDDRFNTYRGASTYLITRNNQRKNELIRISLLKEQARMAGLITNGGGGKQNGNRSNGKQQSPPPVVEANNVDRNKKGNGGKGQQQHQPKEKVGKGLPSPKYNDGNCFNCDTPGHIAANCPKPKKEHHSVESNENFDEMQQEQDVPSSEGKVTKRILLNLENEKKASQPISLEEPHPLSESFYVDAGLDEMECIFNGMDDIFSVEIHHVEVSIEISSEMMDIISFMAAIVNGSHQVEMHMHSRHFASEEEDDYQIGDSSAVVPSSNIRRCCYYSKC